MADEIKLRYVKDDTNKFMDFVGDLGLNLNCSAVTVVTSGANDIIAPTGANKLKIYKVLFSCTLDITGEVYLSWDGAGSKLGSVLHPKAGGEYVLLSISPNFILGAAGVKLIVNLPSNTESRVSAAYTEIP